jgi:hypothetical protein
MDERVLGPAEPVQMNECWGSGMRMSVRLRTQRLPAIQITGSR